MLALARMPCDEGVIRAGRAHVACAERSKPWVLVATILGSSLAFIDSSVVNIALPAIQADLAASVAAAQWLINAYLLFLGALLLVGGAAGDRFGRRRVFMLGIVFFTAASVACGLAPNVAILIAARAVQGIGGAMLVPESLAIVSAVFPPEERGRAIGTWAGFSALTTALGPVLGGALIDTLSWRAVFFINLPVALITLAVALRHIPESKAAEADTGVDWRGGLLATISLGCIAYGATAGSQTSWGAPQVVIPVAAGVILLLLFLRAEARAPVPMVPLGLFRSSAFSGANAVTFLLYAALSAMLFFLPFNLIRLQGYSAAAAGAAFLPFSLIMGGFSRWTGGWADKIGPRLPLTFGPFVVAWAFALFAVPGIGSSFWRLFLPPMVILGIGMAISVAPLTTTVMGAVDQQHAGAASGINNAVARIAGMLAVAIVGAIGVGIFGAALDQRLDHLQLAPELRRAMDAQIPRLAEASVPAGVNDRTRAALEAAIDDAFLHAFRAVMMMTAGLGLASGVCAALTIPRAPPPR